VKIDSIATETERIVGHIWSDHCIIGFDDVIIDIGNDEAMLCSGGEACGITSFEVLLKLGAQA
jgi:hypothetical protein